MVDTSLAAFRLLELVALLFPVVALLLQLQHRVVEDEELERLGIGAGACLLGLLSLSFFLLSFHLVSAQPLPSVLSMTLVGLSIISLLLPVLVVLSSRKFTERAKQIPTALDEASDVARRALDFESSETRSEPPESDEEQN